MLMTGVSVRSKLLALGLTAAVALAGGCQVVFAPQEGPPVGGQNDGDGVIHGCDLLFADPPTVQIQAADSPNVIFERCISRVLVVP